MTSVSFVDQLAVKRRQFRKRRESLAMEPKPPSPLGREVADALEAEVAAINRAAKREFGGAVEVRGATLNWINSAEYVAIVRTSSKHSMQLHYPIVAGAILFERDGDLEIASASTIEGLGDFLTTLRTDVAEILAAAKFDTAMAALPTARPGNAGRPMGKQESAALAGIH